MVKKSEVREIWTVSRFCGEMTDTRRRTSKCDAEIFNLGIIPLNKDLSMGFLLIFSPVYIDLVCVS